MTGFTRRETLAVTCSGAVAAASALVDGRDAEARTRVEPDDPAVAAAQEVCAARDGYYSAIGPATPEGNPRHDHALVEVYAAEHRLGEIMPTTLAGALDMLSVAAEALHRSDIPTHCRSNPKFLETPYVKWDEHPAWPLVRNALAALERLTAGDDMHQPRLAHRAEAVRAVCGLPPDWKVYD